MEKEVHATTQTLTNVTEVKRWLTPRSFVLAVAFMGGMGFIFQQISLPTWFRTSKRRVNEFHLPVGRSIYVVGRDDWVDNWSDPDEDSEHSGTDTRAAHLARDEFSRLGKIALASSAENADFIFLLVMDPSKTRESGLAELFTAACYRSIISEPGKFCESEWHATGNTPSQLVAQFHKEVLH